LPRIYLPVPAHWLGLRIVADTVRIERRLPRQPDDDLRWSPRDRVERYQELRAVERLEPEAAQVVCTGAVDRLIRDARNRVAAAVREPDRAVGVIRAGWVEDLELLVRRWVALLLWHDELRRQHPDGTLTTPAAAEGVEVLDLRCTVVGVDPDARRTLRVRGDGVDEASAGGAVREVGTARRCRVVVASHGVGEPGREVDPRSQRYGRPVPQVGRTNRRRHVRRRRRARAG